MKPFIILFSIAFAGKISFAQNNVGIGTTTPHADAVLHVEVGSTAQGLLVSGAYNGTSAVPNLGASARLMFYPGKGAFRAGYVSTLQWDNSNVGRLSAAMGYNTTASGASSTAMGFISTASGQYSTAMGYNTIASGITSTAMGSFNTASGDYSTAMGYSTDASGDYSTAMGGSTTASGDYSTAMGYFTTASGNFSTAMGYRCSTNGLVGAFVIGDHSTSNYLNAANSHSFSARFSGGYRLFTNSAMDVGVRVAAGGNSWVTISDIKRKENLLPVDGEDFLGKISAMNLSSWNYKGQDPKHYRHYGPMAQEFHAAFGRDSYGTIGDDTTINQADFDGVNLIAIQALERRTTTHKEALERLRKENEELTKKNEALKARLDKLEKMFLKKD